MQVRYDTEVDLLEIVLLTRDQDRVKDITGNAVALLDKAGNVTSIEIMEASQHYPIEELLTHSVDPLLPLAEAAQQVGMTPDALKHLAQKKRLTAYKIGRNWVTTKPWLQAYKRSLRRRGPTRATAVAPKDRAPIKGRGSI